jgi:2-(1,2-epoxy-1,2-dihydrophenyl)acetyl-CoA isomerase
VALACDLIYAKAEARFVSGFAQIGLCPDAGQSYHLVRALGRAKAIEFSLNGRPFTAQDFYQAGLVNGLFEHYEQVLQHWKEPLTHLAPLSLKAIKKNFHLASEHSFEHVLKQETEMQQMLGGSHDFHEGVRAFIEKRKPQFSGR